MEQLIRKYHSQQFRNNKKEYVPVKIPYTDHLFGVKSILTSVLSMYDECKDLDLQNDMCCAALGHDLLEDTDTTEALIVEATNDRVLNLIKELTNPVDDAHTDQYMQQLSKASEEARLIKYADLIENTLSVAYNYYHLGERWVQNFYEPILLSTQKVLAETEFEVYSKTASYMRSLLSVSINLLYEKRRNCE